MERLAACSWRRWIVVLALGLAATGTAARVTMAMGAMTPEEIAQACREEMEEIAASLEMALDVEGAAFAERLNGLPPGATVSVVFKHGSTSSARIDKLFRSSAIKITKILDKSIARIERLGGDPAVATDLFNDGFGLLLELKVAMLQEQSGLVDGVDARINAKFPL